VRIRPARPHDLPGLQDIERRASAAFRDIGMPEIADDEPPSISEYRQALRAWVAVDDDDVPVAYVIVEVADGNLHIEQVTVDPSVARRGVGASLIDHAAEFAREIGFPALTLTTFRDVPWNAPYYRRLGFAEFSAVGPEVAQIRRREAENGLDRWPRVSMIRSVRR
jgi:GNAT superfamily N-acetyltransferase